MYLTNDYLFFNLNVKFFFPYYTNYLCFTTLKFTPSMNAMKWSSTRILISFIIYNVVYSHSTALNGWISIN